MSPSLVEGRPMRSDLTVMSQREILRLQAMQRLDSGSLSQADIAAQLRLCVRQVKRLLRRYRLHGASGLTSQKRGRPSNHRTDPALLARALAIVASRYADFGPTLASEKLAERDQIRIPKETLRTAMIAADLWKPRRSKRSKAHPPRERRACFGELVQIDGSHSPQAKGRVERANGVLQDRLVKELRLENISTIDDANAFVPNFITRYNERFAVEPRSTIDAHRPVASNVDIDRILCSWHPRVISKNLTVQFGSSIYEIIENAQPRRLQHARVIVLERKDGTVVIERDGQSLPYRIRPIADRRPKTVDAKTLADSDQSSHDHRAPNPKKGHRLPPEHPWTMSEAVPSPYGQSYLATAGFSRTPIPSISTRTRSPGLIQRRGLREVPTPAGVPVATMSPGSSVITAESSAMMRATPNTISDVEEFCSTSSPIVVRMRSACGSAIASRVTSTGPHGPCVSKTLPIVHCDVRIW